MARVKRGTTKNKSRRNVLSLTKGYRGNQRTKKRAAYTALYHAGVHAFAHRRDKKNDFRRLWTVQINAALASFGISYSKFIKMLATANVSLDRKVLAQMANESPETFGRVVTLVNK
jgi:large subunit ribosomal protein L20